MRNHLYYTTLQSDRRGDILWSSSRTSEQHEFGLICIKNKFQLMKGILDDFKGILQVFNSPFKSWCKAITNRVISIKMEISINTFLSILLM